MKVRALTAGGKCADAAKLLESLPDQEAGGETTTMLLELYTESGQPEKAAVLAEKIFARDPKHYQVAHRVANTLLGSGDLDRAQIAAGAHPRHDDRLGRT